MKNFLLDKRGREELKGGPEIPHETCIHYPPEVSSIKYCCLGVFWEEYFRLITIYIANRKKTTLKLA